MRPSIQATSLRVTEAGGQTTVCFSEFPTLNEDNAATVGEALSALIEGRDRPDLILDLAEVRFLTSVVLSKFIALNGQLRASGGQLKLVNLRPTVHKVFVVSRLDRILNICETDKIPAV